MSASNIVLMIDHDHIGRVLAARHRVGPGYIHDVREAFKRRRAVRNRKAVA